MKELNFNKQKLQQVIENFSEYAKEPRFKEDIIERRERKTFFQKFIGKKINDLDFSEIIKKLWAAKIWGNQDYLVSKIIKDNGIQKISESFSYLFSTEKRPGDRYEYFLNNIKGMGPSMVTEIICCTDPKNAGIWNDKVRKALAWLEVKDISYDEYKITGKEYDDFNQFAQYICNLLAEKKYQDVDLLFVDYFLWEIYDKFAKLEKIKTPIKGQIEKEASRHDEIKDKIAGIGTWLGFEVETEKLIATGARVDIIWKARIANLGAVSYIFEVQYRGSIDGLLLNLQKAQTNPTVQKLIIVSDGEQIEKIKNEIKTLPENFRRAVAFWEAENVDDTYQNLEQVTDSITELHLMEE